MTRLATTLAALRKRGEGAFMPFLVLGDPNAQASLAAAEALIQTGADIMEFGFPFSDPPADGPVIQAADQRSLATGTTVDTCFELIAQLRHHHDLPITLLVYANLVLQRPLEAFYRDCATAGVDAVLVADMPPEEASEAVLQARKHGVAPIFVVSELTTTARLRRILQDAEGYLYVVARLGVTGVSSEKDTAKTSQLSPVSPMSETFRRLRAQTSLPLMAGFGVSAPQQARSLLLAGADGVICGSAIVRRLAQAPPSSSLTEVLRFANAMKQSTLPDPDRESPQC